ncbi:hypothetical protein [Lentzea sp. NPDC055074]
MSAVDRVAALVRERNRIDAAAVVAELRARGRRIGTASSVRDELWDAAEIYPRRNPSFPLTDEQREMLALFCS